MNFVDFSKLDRLDFFFSTVATEDSNITIAEHSTHSESSSPENTNSDDFVLVPTNLPTDSTILNYERK